MSTKPTRLTGALAVVMAVLGSIAFAQQRDVARPPASSAAAAPATLNGRVVSADDGRPVRGATVRISGSAGGLLGESGPSRSTLTDGDGRFAFAELRAGSATVSVTKPGWVAQQSGQRHALRPGRSFQIAAGGRYSIDFTLLRGSAISGTIIDPFGDPVAGALVEVRRARMVRGQRQLTAVVELDKTDDTGAFRLHSLPAGDYYVTARFTAMTNSPIGDAADAGAPLGRPSYYPGTPSMAEAQRISLATGEDRLSVVFPLAAVGAVRVSGILVDASGTPLDGESVELLDAADFSVVARSYGNFGETYDGGRFTMINVLPGSYALVARVSRPTGPETAFLPITVTGAEVSGITLAAARGVTLSGSIDVPPGAPRPGPGITVAARSIRGSDSRSDTIERGAAFTLSGLFGPYALSVDDLPRGWTVQSIEINGVDATDGVVNFPASGRMAARLVLTNRPTELTGTVTSDQAPVPDADVVIFPDDPGRWAYPSRSVRTARTDASGRYQVVGLPPAARYLAIAVDDLEEDEYQDPDVLERLRPRAAGVPLGEGAKATVNLTLVRR